MKKWIAIVLLLGGLGRIAYAIVQAHSIGIVTAVIDNKTLAQINSYQPGSTGQLIYCNDCTQSPLCVSSGTTVGAWIAVSSNTLAHCH